MAEFRQMADALAEDALLSALAPDALAQVLRAAKRRELEPGEVIIEQGGAKGDFAVYLLSGTLKVSMVSANGREIILHYCQPGEIVGEIAMLDEGPRTASVTAVKPSSVLLIPAQVFLDTVIADPASMVGVMRELASRLRQTDLVIESDRSFSMAPRLARALLRLRDPHKADGELQISPSQSDLGAFAGLARENVSRLLSDWEERGVIERDEGAIVIREIEYLQALADFGE